MCSGPNQVSSISLKGGKKADRHHSFPHPYDRFGVRRAATDFPTQAGSSSGEVAPTSLLIVAERGSVRARCKAGRCGMGGSGAVDVRPTTAL